MFLACYHGGLNLVDFRSRDIIHNTKGKVEVSRDKVRSFYAFSNYVAMTLSLLTSCPLNIYI